MSSSNAGAFTSNASPPGPIDEKIGGDTRLIQSSSTQSQSLTLPRLQWKISRKTLVYLRLLIFIILEMGYIILAAVCLAKPVPLSLHFNFAAEKVEGGFTVVFIVWQSIAILMGAYFAADAFSREWSFQLTHIAPGTDRNSLRAIDRVSTMTSGFIDRTSHLLFKKPSGTFKLAFLASISFMALSSLAPGTINVDTILIDSPTTLQIGRLVLSHATDDKFAKSITTIDRANLILRLEMIEHSPFGLNLEPNMLTVVPRVDLASFNGTIEYNSDVIEFHHDCHWEAPRFFYTSDDDVIIPAADQQWYGATVGLGLTYPGSSVGPLYLKSYPITGEVSTSAFIFSGGNTSISIPQSNPPKPFAIDLGSLPTTFDASGAGLELEFNSSYAPLSSILICDPRLKISGGRIRVTNDGTLKVINSGETPIGNIPRSEANLIFTNAFQIALWVPEILTEVNAVNNLASIMFMPNSSTVDWNTARNIRPLDLPSINKNMDTFMLSGAKAYIDGYNKKGTNPVAGYNLETVSAMGQRQTYALSTSKWLFIAIVALFAIATLLLLAIFTSTRKTERLPFDLINVFNALSEEGGTSGSLAAQNR
ncbi:hypothetical protein AGABI1DRAFT_104369 [Agaricus bisporus var. burnettii JB137-S8]|uniref:Uncharacterized protein n=1 Tax=Agaricus bisporus var. burnettii (strain JB137-S8 / ATCC MYA-4627 / FGSC 10392) TaxID=597362 RepID=K5W687_AGABU|nr:uncharacterized protein AGABI1DRAFT_104369 [Agaricus bisporus var. burnettii JB137-S8]EKM82344.1 hypothetical protein AGABI1DRAFT_104369 [Agaricus bisporus var. burnettii JB137-S8]